MNSIQIKALHENQRFASLIVRALPELMNRLDLEGKNSIN